MSRQHLVKKLLIPDWGSKTHYCNAQLILLFKLLPTIGRKAHIIFLKIVRLGVNINLMQNSLYYAIGSVNFNKNGLWESKFVIQEKKRKNITC